MGVLDATPDVRMNATFSPGNPPAGGISFMSQSGALGVAILLATEKLNLGFAYFASVGNKADVSGNDLIEYWENDPHTSIITMYIESFGNPRKFTELASRVSRKKPIVIVKSGTSAAGARAASSHTGSLAGTEAAADALLRQVGVMRVSSIEEMIHLLQALTGTVMPKGNRLCLVTNAGGPAIMAADAADGHGLQIATLADETKKAMRKVLPPEASVENPVDMIAKRGSRSIRSLSRAGARRSQRRHGDSDFRSAADRRTARSDAPHHARRPRGRKAGAERAHGGRELLRAHSARSAGQCSVLSLSRDA
jgi:acyl-CoA synthetase (NDP forming)